MEEFCIYEFEYMVQIFEVGRTSNLFSRIICLVYSLFSNVMIEA